MSDLGPKGTFLERRSYRRRRLVDCARLLPIVGVWLWLVPVLWQGAGDGDAMKLSTGLIYVFAVWGGLVIAGGLLVALLALVHSGPSSDTSSGVRNGDA